MRRDTTNKVTKYVHKIVKNEKLNSLTGKQIAEVIEYIGDAYEEAFEVGVKSVEVEKKDKTLALVVNYHKPDGKGDKEVMDILDNHFNIAHIQSQYPFEVGIRKTFTEVIRCGEKVTKVTLEAIPLKEVN